MYPCRGGDQAYDRLQLTKKIVEAAEVGQP